MSPGLAISRFATRLFDHASPTGLASGPHDRHRYHYLIPIMVTGFPMSQDTSPWDPQYLDSRFSPDARHASLGWTTQLLSVNHGSRFRVARVLCIRNPRYAELRLSRILGQVSLLFGWLRSYREFTNRDFLLQQFYTPKISEG